MKQNFDLAPFFQKIHLPDSASHKGQNGKLMIIGGSDLFHAASRWSLDVASRFVDMVFYSSTPENNQLIKEAKQNFWNGIVVSQSERDGYIAEADVVLVGPGMTRTEETAETVNELLKKYSHKKMVLDAGALQMLDPTLLNQEQVLTPHHQELALLLAKVPGAAGLKWFEDRGVGVLLKGPVDEIDLGSQHLTVMGGNAGMTKGGTGDVLSGLVAALYCGHDALTALVVASYINKRAGEVLFEKVGPFFNATDLANAVPEVMWRELNVMIKR